MLSITVDEIQRDPLKYIHQVETGETIVIVKNDKPIAEIKPVSNPKQLRPFGLCAGDFSVPDDFDDPLPDGILATFEGK